MPTRYFPQASSASFGQSTVYGLSILWLLVRYLLHRADLVHQKQFDSLRSRYAGTKDASARLASEIGVHQPGEKEV